jgi:hypothetical protein
MKGKKKRKNSTGMGGASKQSCSLLELPATALALIYQLLDSVGRSNLLRTSRGGRDLVLAEARALKLQRPAAAAAAPFARMLKRARTSGLTKLIVDMHAVDKQKNWSRVLADFVRLGGWPSIQDFTLWVSWVNDVVAMLYSIALVVPLCLDLPDTSPICCRVLKALRHL